MDKITLLFYGKITQFCNNTTSIVAHGVFGGLTSHGGLWWAYLHKKSYKPLKLKYET